VTAGPTPLALHHVGYVVPDIAAAAPAFATSLAASWDGCVYADPHQKVKVTFLTTRPGDAQIELVEPAGDDSPVRAFLREKGGGLHHVCYEVPDLEEALDEMKSRGALLARRPKPAVAFRGRRIAWVLTREKLLIEFLEARSIQ
jgi:methylmalonyl-CoA/ethylmalonyl-CoA epimerase